MHSKPSHLARPSRSSLRPSICGCLQARERVHCAGRRSFDADKRSSSPKQHITSRTVRSLKHTTKGEQHTMSKIGKSRCAIAVGAVALALGAAQVNAAELTVVNFGGANGDAQKVAFNQPFETQTSNKVTAVEYNGEQAKVKAMVEAKHVNWD